MSASPTFQAELAQQRIHDTVYYLVAYETDPIAVDDGIIGRQIVFDGHVIIHNRCGAALDLVKARRVVWEYLRAHKNRRIQSCDVQLVALNPLTLPIDPELRIDATLVLDT